MFLCHETRWAGGVDRSLRGTEGGRPPHPRTPRPSPLSLRTQHLRILTYFLSVPSPPQKQNWTEITKRLTLKINNLMF